METLGTLILVVVGLFLIGRKALLKTNRSIQKIEKAVSSLSNEQKDKQNRSEVFDRKTASKPKSNTRLRGSAYVTDGDTITIKKTQIRLFGIDAPELNHPFGQKSKWALVGLVKGKQVAAEILSVDDYGRTVAQCYLDDGSDLSAEMVKIGMAIDWKKFSGGIYRRFETEDARKKLWLADARQKGRMDLWEKFEKSSGQTKKP